MATRNGRSANPAPTANPESSSNETPLSMRPKATWLDWIAEKPTEAMLARAQPMLSRSALLDRLKAEGVKASARDLSFWQQEGVIPYPTKQLVRGGVAAAYPSWMADVIAFMREGQMTGRTLDELALDLRIWIAQEYGEPLTGNQEADLNSLFSSRAAWAQFNSLAASLKAASYETERLTKRTIGRIEVTFHEKTKEESSKSRGYCITFNQPGMLPISIVEGDFEVEV